MANTESCNLSPVIKKREGQKIVEKDSKLFKDIKDVVQDYENSWNLWAYTKTPEFKEKYKNVEYDELGEVTFPSLIKALGWEKLYNDSKSLERVIKDYGFNKPFNNPHSLMLAVNSFNNKEDRFVAIGRKTTEGYKAEVFNKNGVNLEKARTQAFNYALSQELVNLLHRLGFDISFTSNPEYAGLFDPENATFNNGLFTVIKIAKGEEGEKALPEEVSHLIIEGLIKHPLVQRLFNTLNADVVQDILGDEYESYAKKYDNDSSKLQKEAAGKLLAQYITEQGTISPHVVSERRSLLGRIWNWVKGLFSKLTHSDIDNAKENAYNRVSQIYGLISSGRIDHLIDRNNVLSGKALYALREKYDSLDKIAHAAENIVSNMRKVEIDSNDYDKKTTEALDSMQHDNDNDANNLRAIKTFLDDTDRHIKKLVDKYRNLIEFEDNAKGDFTTIRTINEAAKVLLDIDTFSDGYMDILSSMAAFGSDDKSFPLDSITQEAADDIAATASNLLKALNTLRENRRATTERILMYGVRRVLPYDTVRGIGSRRNEVMEASAILDHAERDINVIDRWFTAMSDADDVLLQVMDGLVKNQKYERDEEVEEWRKQIAKNDQNLRNAGFKSSFMNETKDGIPTMRIISPYDFDAYNEDFAKKKKRGLQEATNEQGEIDWSIYREVIGRWKGDKINGEPRLIKVYVDPDIDKAVKEGRKAPEVATYEMMPNPKVYPNKVHVIEDLSDAQRTYYNKMMYIKRKMMIKIPHRGQAIYRSIYISKDTAEGILDNGLSEVWGATKDNLKKKFERRSDDVGFGSIENLDEILKNIVTSEKDPDKAANRILEEMSENVDNDVLITLKPDKLSAIIKRYRGKEKDNLDNIVSDLRAVIEAEDYFVVNTDFANHEVHKIPVYYVRKLHDPKMLSNDFSGCLTAYTAMATNYEKMSQVVDLLELMYTKINEREVRKSIGDKPFIAKYNALGKVYKNYVTLAGRNSNAAGRARDYIDSAVYEIRKNSEGTMHILGANVDIAKTLDAIKDYTGLLGLGLNIFSSISNITQGKWQMWVECFAKEHWDLKDYAKACGQYSSLIGGCFMEMNSPVKKNKLSLLIAMFDPMGEYFEGMRDARYNKNPVARILGNGILGYIGMNAGEHMLHCQAMLAMLNHIKLQDKDNNDISLYDALEVKEGKDGIYRLELKKGLSYKRELIDNRKNPKLNKNYGRPLRDEDGKIKTETIELKSIDDDQVKQFIFSTKKYIRKVCDAKYGAFGVDDKGAINRWAVMRLIMQYRQWMVAFYEDRFARAHYDMDMGRWREGYYLTTFKVANQLIAESRRSKHEYAKVFNRLSESEKANLRRAGGEIGMFAALATLVKFCGRKRDGDRSWFDKMFIYQLNRLKLETGAGIPGPAFLSNIFQLLHSPFASLDSIERLTKVFKLWNMADEVQTGRYQGWSEWGRDVFETLPYASQIYKAYYFDDSMFSMFNTGDDSDDKVSIFNIFGDFGNDNGYTPRK